MAGLKEINDNIAKAIANCCPSIQQISFRNCELTDEGVCEIAIHCSKLTMIALAGIHNLTDKCVKALAENCPYLRELYLSGCAKITRQAVTYLKVINYAMAYMLVCVDVTYNYMCAFYIL